MSQGEAAGSGEKPPPKEMDFAGALDKGMAALQNAFEGIVNAAKKAIGPELLRNAEAAAWLGGVATCLEATAAAPTTALAGKSGELACHLERLDAELNGSKFEGQKASFRQRLEAVVAAIGSGGAASAKAQEAAGYFRAAASSVTLPTGTHQTITLNPPK